MQHISRTELRRRIRADIALLALVLATVLVPHAVSAQAAPSSMYHVCASDGYSVGISWTPDWSGNAPGESYALRVDNENTSCGGITGPSNNVGCVSGTDYVEDNIPLDTYTRLVYFNPYPSSIRTWVHRVSNGSWSAAAQDSFTCIVPPPTCSLSANPSTVSAGQGTTFIWTTQGAGSFSIYPAPGSMFQVPWSSSWTYAGPINQTTTFIGTVTNAAGTSQCYTTVTVQSPAPTVSFSASPTSITTGNSSTLSWSSSNAASCTGTGFSTGGATAGSTSVSPGSSTTYQVSCTGAGGSASKSATVSVTVAPPPAPTVSLSASPTSITTGNSSTLTWSSANATSCTGTGFSTGGATSGSVSVSPSSNTTYNVSCTGAGGSGSASVTVTVTGPPGPSCTVTLDASTVPYGTGTTLRWTSSDVTSFYISNIGYVTPVASGAVAIAPSQTTSYAASCTGPGGTVAASSGTQTLTVTPPATPTANITASSASITVGQSTTINASFSVDSNDTLTAANIDQPLGTGRAASTAPGPKSYAFTPTSAGTYTFYARATTQYYTAWTTYAQVTVQVTAVPTCSFAASPPSVIQGQTVTITWNCSNAISCTGTNFSTGGSISGQASVIAMQSTTYSISCTNVSGTVYSGIASSQVTVSCASLYSCSGSNITYTNASCETSTVDSCAAPSYCEAGQSSCQFASIEFVPLSSGLTGHLQAQPVIIRGGDRTRLYWQVTGAQSCTVSGGGQNWTGVTSGSSGVQTNPLTQLTRYTMVCEAYPGHDDVTETFDVLVVPQFQET